jgi:hypothetical protein
MDEKNFVEFVAKCGDYISLDELTKYVIKIDPSLEDKPDSLVDVVDDVCSVLEEMGYEDYRNGYRRLVN